MQVIKTEELNNAIMDEFAKTVELFGVNSTEARLFSMLHLKKEPMTLDQMSVAMGKSKTAMSTGIRSLIDLNLVERVWKKGERKDWFQTDDDLFHTFMTAYISKWLEAAARQKNALLEIDEVMEKKMVKAKQSDTSLEDMYDRLQQLIDFHHSIERAFSKIKPPSLL